MSEMVNMAPPWAGMTSEEISRAVAAGQRPSIASELEASAPAGWIELMQQCWDQEPMDRPTFDSIYNALDPIQKSMGSQGVECSSRLTNETITHAGNDKLIVELNLQPAIDRLSQVTTNNITIV